MCESLFNNVPSPFLSSLIKIIVVVKTSMNVMLV